MLVNRKETKGDQNMLILTRKDKQRIMIGEDIILTIIEIQGNQVIIGIDAPLETPINREEIYLKKYGITKL